MHNQIFLKIKWSRKILPEMIIFWNENSTKNKQKGAFQIKEVVVGSLSTQHISLEILQGYLVFPPKTLCNKQKFCFLWDQIGRVACQDDMWQLHYFLKSCYDSSVVSSHIAVIFCHISHCDQLYYRQVTSIKLL